MNGGRLVCVVGTCAKNLTNHCDGVISRDTIYESVRQSGFAKPNRTGPANSLARLANRLAACVRPAINAEIRVNIKY